MPVLTASEGIVSTKISLLNFLMASSMSAALRCLEDDPLRFRILLNERAVAAAAEDGGGGMGGGGGCAEVEVCLL